MDTAYSGYLGRAAHFAMRPPAPGVAADHGPQAANEPEDIFQPQPDTPDAQSIDIWQPQSSPPQGPIPFQPIAHWTDLAPPVPSNINSWSSGQTATERMLANHSIESPHLDQYPLYHHGDEGESIEWDEGRGSMESGETITEDMQYLVAGRNAYDYTNQPNEVYSAETSGGGRYRLGLNTQRFGIYPFWTLQGQEPMMRAYTGLVPWMPVDKPRVADSAPYTPNSSGTTTWEQPAFRTPSMFTLPAETSVTDYEITQSGGLGAGTPSDFVDDTGRL
jgi:hypothetical protein